MNNLKEICMCYYFGDIIKIEDVVLLVIFYWMKNRTRIF